MSTALVFFCVKCAFKNTQKLTGVMSKSTRCQTECCKSSCANVCKRTQMIDQIWQKSLANLSSSRKCYGSLDIFFNEGNVSFNTKDFDKQLAQSHTFQYVYMSRREIGISQSSISFFSWRVIRLHDFVSSFGFLMFRTFSKGRCQSLCYH